MENRSRGAQKKKTRERKKSTYHVLYTDMVRKKERRAMKKNYLHAHTFLGRGFLFNAKVRGGDIHFLALEGEGGGE
jgi:hypothetical protein